MTAAPSMKRHHHIGQDEGDFIFVFGVERHGLGPVRRGQNTIAEGLQRLAGDGEDGGFIIDDQNHLAVSLAVKLISSGSFFRCCDRKLPSRAGRL